MKKWLVGLLVLLALVVLVSPGIIGILTEQSFEEAVSRTSDDNEIVVTTERFDRDWFTSAGSHRVELRGGDLYTVASDFAKQAGEPSVPALIINTEITHGFVPLDDGETEDDSLIPALGRSVSTMQLETDDGRTIDLPGTLYTSVSLGGTTSSRYVLEPGAAEGPSISGEWAGADIDLTIPPSGTGITVSGSVEPWSMTSASIALNSGEIVIDAEKQATRYGFDVGSIDLRVPTLTIAEASETLDVRKPWIKGNSDVDAGRLAGDGRLSIESMTIPGFGELGINILMSTDGIDAAALQSVFEALEEAEASPDPDLTMDDIDAMIEPDMQLLLSRGGAIHVEQLEVRSPDGSLTAELTFEMPESDTDEAKGWAGLTLLMDAAIDIRIDDDLLRFLQSMNPELSSLIALGYLRPDNGSWTLHAEIVDGIITINGAPMAIPMAAD